MINEKEKEKIKEISFCFEDLPPILRENIKKLGWIKPMPVQSKVAPILLDKKDLIVQSRTGSGKTGAFMIPILLQIESNKSDTQAIILVPTRELAMQVGEVASALAENTGIRCVSIYGGVSYRSQIEAIRKGAHVIVATPGRLLDHLMNRRISLKSLSHLIFDEADEMLSMGFYDSIIRIMSYIPEKRITALFSATIPPGVAKLAKKFIHNPVHISLSGDVRHVEEVDHVYYIVDPMRKDRSLLKIIEMENPEAALIFCNTKSEVEYLAKFLQNFGYDADYLSGDLSQSKRDEVMRKIREGKLRFLVATDVAARGIDISELGYVIVYDLPPAHDDYIHRAGRTGRAGEGGLAISLVSYIEEVDLKKRAEQNKLSLIKRELPTDEELQARVSERLVAMLEQKYISLSNSVKERLKRFVPLAQNLAKEDESEINIIAMLFDLYYQDILHKSAGFFDSQKYETNKKIHHSDAQRKKSFSQKKRKKGINFR